MRNITLIQGEYYHLYNRGVDKRTIFTSPAEYKRFLAYLFLLNDAEHKRVDYLLASKKPIWEAKPSRPLIAIGAYCLMPNHFHLYVTQMADGGISKFMQRIQTAYTMYFNKKHGRTGSLLQGTFKSQHVAEDVYAKYLLSYIHLNPAKLKDPRWKTRGSRQLKALASHVRDYPYSSFQEYARNEHLITAPAAFPSHLATSRDLHAHIADWMEAKSLEGLAFQREGGDLGRREVGEAQGAGYNKE